RRQSQGELNEPVVQEWEAALDTVRHRVAVLVAKQGGETRGQEVTPLTSPQIFATGHSERGLLRSRRQTQRSATLGLALVAVPCAPIGPSIPKLGSQHGSEIGKKR